MWRSWLTRGAIIIAPLIPLLLLAGLLAPAAVQAQGGLALSGSFYQQAFEIPQGSSVSGPSVYVVVFNNGAEDLKVKMSSQAPLGVNITLSQSEFTLPAGGQQQVLVGVEVTKDAAPGEYEISVTAESYKENVSGIQLAGAARQNAKLTVLGESAQVTVQAASPDGQPVVATVRLYRVVSGQSHEVAYSETGTLEAKVAPGDFTADSYIGGQQVAEQSFTLAANDNKTVTLTGATVYFEGFGVLPNYYKNGGQIAFAQIAYSVKNLYQPVDKGEVVLEVTLNNTPLEEVPLATLTPLGLGRTELNYNYIPSGGWVDGNYGFKLQLNLNGQPYANSLVQQLVVGAGSKGTPGSQGTPGAKSSGGGGSNTGVIVGIVAGVAVVSIAGFLLVRRRRKA